MIDNTGLHGYSVQRLADVQDTTLAASWVATLRARGVSVTLRGNRLELRPANAYKALSDAELLTLRHHREAIKQVVRDAPTTQEPAPPREQAPAAPRMEKPAPCQWCNRAPCIGVEHPAFYTLHPLEAQKREDERHNKEFRLAFGLDSWPRADEQPAQTEEQRRQAALRSKLGWDSGSYRV